MDKVHGQNKNRTWVCLCHPVFVCFFLFSLGGGRGEVGEGREKGERGEGGGFSRINVFFFLSMR